MNDSLTLVPSKLKFRMVAFFTIICMASYCFATDFQPTASEGSVEQSKEVAEKKPDTGPRLHQEIKLLDAKKLQAEYLELQQSAEQAKNVKSHLIIELTEDTFKSYLELEGQEKIVGRLECNLIDKNVQIDFGPVYGKTKLILNERPFRDFTRAIAEVKERYGVGSLSSLKFEYHLTTAQNAETKVPETTGKIKFNDKEKDYDRNDKKDKSANGSFWKLFEAVLAQLVQEEDADLDLMKIEAYEKAVSSQDLKKFEGVFTFYQKNNQVLLEIPINDLGKEWVLQGTVHSSNATIGGRAGEPLLIGEGGAQGLPVSVLRWEKRESKLCLVRPRGKYRWSKNAPLAEAADLAYKEAVIASFPIEQENPRSNLILANITPLFLGVPFEFDQMIQFSGGFGLSLDAENSVVDYIKSFPKNSLVRMNLHFSSNRSEGFFGVLDHYRLEDPRSLSAKVTYNLWYREPSGYTPRYADTRIGYFATRFKDVDRYSKLEDTRDYIHRFHLKKKDPSAEMSEPVNPIIWHIDPSVPAEHRAAVKEGILAWNEAFEAIGFKNALIVKDAPKGDPDWDHADGRNNVVRWVIDLGIADAIARTDPYTGEILNAGVNIDAAIIKYSDLFEYIDFIEPFNSKVYSKKEDYYKNILHQIHAGHPLVKDGLCCKNQSQIHLCQWSKNIKGQLPLEWSALAAGGMIPKISRAAFMSQRVKSLVMHEMGHTLGLRHNFTACTFLTTAQLANDKLIEKYSSVGSVMAYDPVNIQTVIKGSGYFFPPKIGLYDKWAIKYGYSEFGSASPDNEQKDLNLIARQSGRKGHAFMTDEDLWTDDPNVTVWTHAKDQVNFSQKVCDVSKALQKTFIQNFFKSGKDYDKRTYRLLKTYLYPFNEVFKMTRFIGGINYSRTRPGDVGAEKTIRPVSAQDQRQAVDFIIKNGLSLDRIDLPENVLQNLSLGYRSLNSPFWRADLRSLIGVYQSILLFVSLNPWTSEKILSNQFLTKSGEVYTLQEHFNKYYAAIYRDLRTKSTITPLRRDLQSEMVDLMIFNTGFGFAPGLREGAILGRQKLLQLRKDIEFRLKDPSGLDEMAKLNLRSMDEKIEKFLKRKETQLVF